MNYREEQLLREEFRVLANEIGFFTGRRACGLYFSSNTEKAWNMFLKLKGKI